MKDKLIKERATVTDKKLNKLMDTPIGKLEVDFKKINEDTLGAIREAMQAKLDSAKEKKKKTEKNNDAIDSMETVIAVINIILEGREKVGDTLLEPLTDEASLDLIVEHYENGTNVEAFFSGLDKDTFDAIKERIQNEMRSMQKGIDTLERERGGIGQAGKEEKTLINDKKTPIIISRIIEGIVRERRAVQARKGNFKRYKKNAKIKKGKMSIYFE